MPPAEEFASPCPLQAVALVGATVTGPATLQDMIVLLDGTFAPTADMTPSSHAEEEMMVVVGQARWLGHGVRRWNGSMTRSVKST